MNYARHLTKLRTSYRFLAPEADVKEENEFIEAAEELYRKWGLQPDGGETDYRASGRYISYIFRSACIYQREDRCLCIQRLSGNGKKADREETGQSGQYQKQFKETCKYIRKNFQRAYLG